MFAQKFNFDKYDLFNYFKDARFEGDNKGNGTIRINGTRVRIEDSKVCVNDIAHAFEVSVNGLIDWIKVNKKYLDKVFYAEACKKEEENRKMREEKIKDLEEEYSDKTCEEYKKQKREISKKYPTRSESIAKVNNTYLDIRVVIPAIASLNPQFANWLSFGVLYNLVLDPKDEQYNIFKFVSAVDAKKGIYIEKLKEEFEENKSEYIEQNKVKKGGKPKEVTEKSMIVLIPSNKTKNPSISFMNTAKVVNKKNDKDFVDIVNLGKIEKPSDFIYEYLTKTTKTINEDEIEKSGGMRISLSKSFTEKSYSKIKDKLLKAVKEHINTQAANAKTEEKKDTPAKRKQKEPETIKPSRSKSNGTVKSKSHTQDSSSSDSEEEITSKRNVKPQGKQNAKVTSQALKEVSISSSSDSDGDSNSDSSSDD